MSPICAICLLVFVTFWLLPQKFENRSTVVLSSEKELWHSLCINDMSEESDDDSDPNTLIIHKLPWRSLGNYNINDFLQLLSLFRIVSIY